MDRSEAIELLGRGLAAWNAWAGEMINERRRLEASGEWVVVESPARGLPDYGLEKTAGGNDSTSDWLSRSEVDFTGHTFDDVAEFESFNFPGMCDFSDCKFSGEANFTTAIFHGDVHFRRSHFFKEAKFENAVFCGLSRFYCVRFEEDGMFSGAEFHDDATFDGSIFLQRIWFDVAGGNHRAVTFHRFLEFSGVKVTVGSGFSGAVFRGPVYFDGTDFGGFVYFGKTQFDNFAYFKNSTFSGWINFSDSIFNGLAIFDFIRLGEESEFSLKDAKFKVAPSFLGCKFDMPPRVDQITIKVPFLGIVRDADMSLRFRALKAFAIAHDDYRSQHEFFVEEMRTARFHKHGPLTHQFWFGLLYELTSDFGRSFLRPFSIWVFLTALFGFLYILSAHDISGQDASVSQNGFIMRAAANLKIASEIFSDGARCRGATNTPTPSKQSAVPYAMIFSFQNALVFPGISHSASDDRIYQCLFGYVKGSPSGATETNIPLGVLLLSAIQTVISGILIFLCGLALRNSLRLQ